MEWTEGIRLWKDYLKMCIDLKCDMNDRTVIFTNNLKLEHDRTDRKYNNIKSQNAIKNFEEAVERYKHLEFEDEEDCGLRSPFALTLPLWLFLFPDLSVDSRR